MRESRGPIAGVGGGGKGGRGREGRKSVGGWLAAITDVDATAWPSRPALPGREGLGVGAAEALGGLQQDELGGAVGIGGNVRIPEPDDAPAPRFEIYRPSIVIG